MNEFYDKNTSNDSDNNVKIDSNFISKFNITNLLGKETLEDIQEKISKAVGLAFVTVDYRGEPITKLTSFTKFCSAVRKIDEGECNCKASDAFGGIQAAVTKKNYVYFCPCGLLEIAIPIIVRGHYLGAFIGGQVRCTDAPCKLTKLENIIITSKKYKEDKYMKELFNSIATYEYEKFLNVAELILLILNQLAEKQAYRLIQNNSLKSELEELKEHIEKLELEKNLKDNELINLKSELNVYSLSNVLNAISNLAIIEDSPRTHKMIIMFSEFLKANICNDKKYVSLLEELRNVEKYLNIQKVKYGDLLQYSIDLPQNMHMQKIPSNVLMPFIENAVFYGTLTKNGSEKVEIKTYYENEDVVICILDDGVGYNDEKIADKFKMFKGNYEGEFIQIGMANVRKKLTTLFGVKYDVFIEKIQNKGTRIIIKYPKNLRKGMSK